MSLRQLTILECISMVLARKKARDYSESDVLTISFNKILVKSLYKRFQKTLSKTVTKQSLILSDPMHKPQYIINMLVSNCYCVHNTYQKSSEKIQFESVKETISYLFKSSFHYFRLKKDISDLDKKTQRHIKYWIKRYRNNGGLL